MKRATSPASTLVPASRDPAQRHRWRRWWPVAAVVLLTATGVAARFAWRSYQLPKRVAAALPALPELAERPTQLQEHLRQAHTLATSRATALAGVIELGRLYHANGFNQEAETCWRLLQAEQPRAARWSYYLADLRRSASDYDEMAALLARTVELAPDYAPAVLQLAQLEFKSGQTDAAAAHYHRRLALIPGDPLARLGLARIDLQHGRRDDARRILEAIIKDAPEFPSGHNLLAEMLAADGDNERARQHRWLGREAGRVREPEDPWLSELHTWCYDPKRLRVLATIQYQTEQGDRGLQLMERAVALAPDVPENHIMLGELHLKLGDNAKAREALRRGIDLATTVKPSALAYVNLSTACRSLGQPEAALAAALEGQLQLPNSFELHDAAGVALGDLGRMEEAIVAFRAALELSPNDANTNFNLALVLLGFGRTDEARTHLQRSLTSQPTFAKSLVLLVQLELEANRLESAGTHVKPLFDAYPEMPRARQLMGIWHRRMGEVAETRKDLAAADRHYREGIAADPTDPELQASLGVLLLFQNRVPESLAPLETYHRLKPLVPQASFFLGQAYARIGRIADAKRVLTEGERLAREANNLKTAEHCREILQAL